MASNKQGKLSESTDPLVERPSYYQPRANQWTIIWSVMGTLVVVMALSGAGWLILIADSDQPVAARQSSAAIPLTPTPAATLTATPSATPSASPTATPAIGTDTFAFSEPTPVPTPVPGGEILVLTPAPEVAGWVVSDDESIVTIFDRQNHFGDSFLYAGTLDGKIYHAAFQFDLSDILRGTKINGASLRLTGLRANLLNEKNDGHWSLQMLSPELDSYWLTANYQQIHRATTWASFKPTLTQAQLGVGQINLFEFTPDQLVLLERRLLETSGKVSFRLDGPATGSDNLFAWDSGSGPASVGAAPELFLNLGPPPKATPLPVYVIITSTPTPETILTAVAISIRLTAEATRIGTATPLPANWVTPFIVTATPTAENEATAELMNQRATAIALTTGEPPPNLQVVTVTPTPTYVIITSTPTPESIMTAMANSLKLTAEAVQGGIPTPLPTNWVTPLVVTSTPTPENTATAGFLQAVALTTGTPTPLPFNAQTATPTPVFIPIDPILSPTPMAVPSVTPLPIPTVLLGKIVFLSDREGIIPESPAGAQLQTPPQIKPLAYVFDPATGQIGRLTDMWPYQVAVARDSWSVDTTYQAYTQQLLWTSVTDDAGVRKPTEELAIHYYDYKYKVENIVTRMGAGIVYDPAWSPVSEEIAFVATESGNDEIWVINRDGSNVRQLTRNQWEWDKHPSWSPDGQQIVFFSNRTGQNQLWIMNKDGGDQRLLMEWNPYNDWDPVWVKYVDPAPSLLKEPDWRFQKAPGTGQTNP